MIIYKSPRAPTAFGRWVLLDEVRGSSPVDCRERSAAHAVNIQKSDIM